MGCDKKRALRRHHKKRMSARARRVFPDWTAASRNGDNITSCSCWMCGNPRSIVGPTIAERRRIARSDDTC